MIWMDVPAGLQLTFWSLSPRAKPLCMCGRGREARRSLFIQLTALRTQKEAHDHMYIKNRLPT